MRKLREIIDEHMLAALHKYNGNLTRAAAAIGVGRMRMYYFIQRNNIDIEAIRGIYRVWDEETKSYYLSFDKPREAAKAQQGVDKEDVRLSEGGRVHRNRDENSGP